MPRDILSIFYASLHGKIPHSGCWHAKNAGSRGNRHLKIRRPNKHYRLGSVLLQPSFWATPKPEVISSFGIG